MTSVEDIRALCKIESEGIDGVITGRAIYQGTLDFKKAQPRRTSWGRARMKRGLRIEGNLPRLAICSFLLDPRS